MTPTDRPSIHIGPRITTLRTAAGITQTALAKQLGISRNWLTEIESGAGKPSIDVLCRIAQTLRVPVADLLRP